MVRARRHSTVRRAETGTIIKVNKRRPGRPLETLPRLQAASDGLLGVTLAACLLVMGCQPNSSGEEQPGPETEVTPTSPPGGAQPADSERPADSAAPARAIADIEPVPGNEVRGTVEFTATDAGVEIQARLEGLPPGARGIHVHELGDCSDPAGDSAGGHFDPDGDPHGAPDDPPAARHAGDLGNLQADETGHAELQLRVEALALEGEYGVVGRSVIVHGGEDDLQTQPDGDAGDPIGCGVIRAAGNSSVGNR